MKNRKEWETKSLEWIHKVRKEMDEEISRKGVTPAQWIRSRGKVDVELLCKKLGLQNYTIVRDMFTPRYFGDKRVKKRSKEIGDR
jgi:hypothetical protein